MIRPLRQMHRIMWPLVAIAVVVALTAAVRLQHAHGAHHAPDTSSNVDRDSQFSWEWHSDGNQLRLYAVAASNVRASTGVADVYRIDDGMPVYLESLSAFRTGVVVDASRGPLTLRIFDVANDQWLGASVTVPER